MIRFEFIDIIKSLRTWAHGFRVHFDDQVFKLIERQRRIEYLMTTANDALQEILTKQNTLESKIDKVTTEVQNAGNNGAIDAALVQQVKEGQDRIAQKLQALDDLNPDAEQPVETPDAGEGEDTLAGENQADHLEGQEQ